MCFFLKWGIDDIKFIGMFKVDFYGKSRETFDAWILRVMEGTNRKFRESSFVF